MVKPVGLFVVEDSCIFPLVIEKPDIRALISDIWLPLHLHTT